MELPSLQILRPPLLLHVHTRVPYASGYLGFRWLLRCCRPTTHRTFRCCFSIVTQSPERCLRICSSSSCCSSVTVCESMLLQLMASVLYTHAVQGLPLNSVFKRECLALVSAKVFQEHVHFASERLWQLWTSALLCNWISALFAQHTPARFLSAIRFPASL
jgi:hypothetical protein